MTVEALTSATAAAMALAATRPHRLSGRRRVSRGERPAATGKVRSRPVVIAAEEVALVLDVLASCLDSGAPMSVALEASASAAGPVLAPELVAGAVALRAGRPPRQVWSDMTQRAPALAAAAAVCNRGVDGGSAIGAELSRIAGRTRRQLQAERSHRVQRASVWIVLPLVTCFLPAFILLGVVPVVLGALSTLMR